MQKRNFSVVSSMTFKQPFRFSWFPILQDFDQVDQNIHCKDPGMSKVYYIYSTYKYKVAKILPPWYKPNVSQVNYDIKHRKCIKYTNYIW